jgi:hypothetical protein
MWWVEEVGGGDKIDTRAWERGPRIAGGVPLELVANFIEPLSIIAAAVT